MRGLPEDIERLLHWADQFEHFAYFCPNDYQYPGNPFPHRLYAGATSYIQAAATSTLNDLQEFKNIHPSAPLIGYLNYSLRTQLENVSNHNISRINAAPFFFFSPLHQIDPEKPTNWPIDVTSFRVPENLNAKKNYELNQDISKEEYLELVNSLQEHIARGDIYETNFCINFWGTQKLDPIASFLELMKLSPMPFSCLMKCGDLYILCASPERYLKKTGTQLLSQPIKGTLASGKSTTQLFSEKERSENIMIVDLVRNDLSKVCEAGSVTVPELCGIYEFPGLYQMISSVEGTISPDKSWMDAIRATFPMGSMTGAPKVSAMQLTDEHEKSARELFSGAIGYITPENDFDFNVVIRTLLYEKSRSKFSFSAGSAITSLCKAEDEYEECILKTRALRKVLGLS